MCHWKKWIWPGILTVAILSLLAVWMKRDFIQDDLAAKATAALTANGQSWAKVQMDGRDATLMGDAPSDAAREQAAQLTDDAYEVRIVDNQSGLMAAQAPYILNAMRAGNKVELSGFVPSEDARASIVETANKALPDTTITDSMTLARGAPEGFETLAGFGFTQLAGLTDGEMSLSDTAMSVKGAAVSRETFDAINTALDGTLPASGTLALKEITPPASSPYQWSADYSGEKVVLGGFVPSSAARDQVIASAKAALPSAEIVDKQMLASGAPEGFENAAAFALQQLPRFHSGKVGLTDLDLNVSGVANSSNNYNAALDAIGAASLPVGMALAESKILPATASPYTWSADFNGGKTILNGFVPDNNARATIVEKANAALPGSEVIDNLQIADGSLPSFSSGVDVAFNVLPKFSSGSVSMSDNKLNIRGVAKDAPMFKSATDIAEGSMSDGLVVASSDITPPTVSPYTWTAVYDGKAVELVGYVPDEATRAGILKAVADTLPDANVDDNMQVAAGAPDGFTEATEFSLAQLPRLSDGSVSLNNLGFSVAGVAKSIDDFDPAKQAVAGDLPAGMSLVSEKITSPSVSPYSWGAEYDGKTVTLAGFVPSNDTREAIIAVTKAKLGGATIVDKMQIAVGEPEGFDMATASAIGVLPRFSKGNVSLSDNNLAVNGTGKTSAHYMAAERYVESGLPEKVKLASSEILPPANEGDYGWQAKKSGAHVVLSGLVPNRGDRAKAADLATKKNPGYSVINRLTIATGAPENFDSNMDLGLSLLSEVDEGMAGINNKTLTVNGVASSVATHQKAMGMMTGVEGEISPPVINPYSWSITKRDDEVLLGGFVPNKGLGNTNVAASEAVLKKPIRDGQRLAAGEPDEFGNATAALISAVSMLDKSSATITGTNVFLQGRATSEDEATRIGDMVGKSLPSNYKYRKQISYPLPKPAPEVALKKVFVPKPVAEPAVCDVDFAALFNGEKIEFDTAKAVIKPESFPLLKRIAAGLNKCKDSHIEVGGHTDARGSEKYNQKLSEARAQAVVTYFTTSDGVSAAKLTAKGYGELQPIAPNTRTERAKNRRIEFKVLGQ